MPARKRHRQQRITTPTTWTQLVPVLRERHEVHALVAHAFDPDRTRPLLVVSCPSDTHEPRVPVADLVAAVGDDADITVVQGRDTTWALSEGLGPNLKAYGGAIRLLYPGATPEARPTDQPLFVTQTDADGPRTVEAIAEHIATWDHRPPPPRSAHLALVHSTSTPDPALARTPVPRAPRADRQPAQPGPVPDQAKPTVPAPASGTSPEPATATTEAESSRDQSLDTLAGATTELAHSNERLADAEHTLAPLQVANQELHRALAIANSRRLAAERAANAAAAEVASLRTQLAEALALANTSEALAARDLDAEWNATYAVAKAERDDALARAAKAEKDNARLRKKVKSLTDQVADLTAKVHGRGAFTDPEAQFRHEVWLDWIHEVDEADREGKYALRPYSLGPDFLDSVADLDGIARERIVSAAQEVISGRVWTSNAREAHQLRTGPAGGAPVLVRADNAVGWRCNLQTKTASARRLMWWEMPDGSVELGRVAVHDDMALR